MTLHGWFGTLAPWLLVALAWFVLGMVFALAVGLLARVEGWTERREGK